MGQQPFHRQLQGSRLAGSGLVSCLRLQVAGSFALRLLSECCAAAHSPLLLQMHYTILQEAGGLIPGQTQMRVDQQ